VPFPGCSAVNDLGFPSGADAARIDGSTIFLVSHQLAW
jgi:hypothetical protein